MYKLHKINNIESWPFLYKNLMINTSLQHEGAVPFDRLHLKLHCISTSIFIDETKHTSRMLFINRY